jgi:hypothetical protein
MSQPVVELAEQLRAEIGAVVGATVALFGPSAAHLEAQLDVCALLWASQLLSDDDKLAAQTVIDLVCVRWPNGTEPPTDWWGTPFGRAVAASVGHPTSDVVSYSVAGAMLGCSKQYIQRMADRGDLVRGGDGYGVTVESVRDRIRRDRQHGITRRTA